MSHETNEQRRKRRVRFNLKKLSNGKVRLTVFRSNKHIHAQLINDKDGVTLASASTNDKDLRGSVKSGSNVESAKMVGSMLAKKAIKAGVKEVYFDRGGYMYHGRVKALAESARENGLSF